MGGNSSPAVTTQQFKPPDNTIPYWDSFLGQATTLANRPYQQYQGMTVAPMNAIQDTGLKMTADRAMFGAPDLNAARGMVTDTANGAYLGANPYVSNPYTDNLVNSTAQNMARAFSIGTAAQNDAMFNKMGVYGGSAWQQKQAQDASLMAGQVGQMASQARLSQANLGANLYQQERGNQLNAAQLAGQLSQDDWKAGTALTGAGDAYNAVLQKGLDASKAEWDKQQMWPALQLDMERNALTSASGQGGSNMSTLINGGGGFSGLAGLLGGAGLGWSAMQYMNGGR